MIYLEVTGVSEAIDYLQEVKDRFALMMQTMIYVAEYVKSETMHYTPIETGRLGESFRYHVLTDNSKFKVVQVQMTALNPNTGYDYAAIQHFNTSYHHEKGQAYYLFAGIQSAKEGLAFQMIEQDYLSLFGGFKV